MKPLVVLFRLVRSGTAGLFATLADLATLTGLVRVGEVSPRIASVPALLVGTTVMYFGQKHLAFGAGGDSTRREVALFILVQAGGFLLTAGLFDTAMWVVPSAGSHYLIARLIVTNLVWLLYSFPLWHFVFRKSSKLAPEAARDALP